MMSTKTDVELIEIMMDCELDYDIRVHAAKEIMRRIEDAS